MIEDVDLQNPGSLGQPASQPDISVTGRRFAGRVVMHEHEIPQRLREIWRSGSVALQQRIYRLPNPSWGAFVNDVIRTHPQSGHKHPRRPNIRELLSLAFQSPDLEPCTQALPSQKAFAVEEGTGIREVLENWYSNLRAESQDLEQWDFCP